MIRKRLAAAALALALLGGFAFADPFTSAFEDIRNAVAGLSEATEGLSGGQKKALKKTTKAIGKNSTSLKKDLATAGKVVKLEKKFAEDAGVLGALDNMIMGLRGAIDTRFAEVSGDVDDLGVAKAAKKAVKLRDQAQDLLNRASDEEARGGKVKFLKKANGKIEGAAKQVIKANKSGGGGGGGDQPCDFDSPRAGESGSVTFEGVNHDANAIEIYIDRDAGAITRFTVLVGRCTKGPDVYRIMELTVEGPPNVGTYFSNLSGGGASAFERTNRFGGFITFGTLTIEKRENGKIEGSFVTREDIDPPILATFVVNDPDAN